ncbi:MAG: hypothetical protein LBC04_02040 [Holosporaceae bacterium]|jgi:hypothetical protein|nr:hypothetical protein [Holosporaceae bacterium]
MKLIFDWSSSFYEDKSNWRGDEEIISLEIFQKECGFAIAKVTIGTRDADKLQNKKYMKIGMQTDGAVELIFSGRLVAFPVGFGGSTMELEFIAEPDDFQTKLSEFSDANFERYHSVDNHLPLKDSILFDDLFFSSRDLKNPTIFLEGCGKIFCWDMRNGQLSLSDIKHGQKNFDINGAEILQDSIRVRVAREPYRVVNLKISASWVQHERGIIDVMPMIAAKFAQRIINSFTNIKSGIKKISSNRGGYEVIHCDIKEINPNNRGFGNEYLLLSPDFYVQKSSDRKKVLFRRFYFAGKLILSWIYKQKRVETVTVRIVNPSSLYGREKNVYLRLNALQLPKEYPIWSHFTYYGRSEKVRYGDSVFACAFAHVSGEIFEQDKWNFVEKIPGALKDDMSSSFFATTRGANAIKYAMQKAIALVNYSSRNIEIDFCVEAKKFMNASVNDQITLHDDRFSGGRISGKIVRMRFLGNADRKIIKFTIGHSGADLSQSFDKLNSHMIIVPADTGNVNPADIVQKIEVENTPEEQIAILAQTVASSSAELTAELKKHETKIKLHLHPLNTARVITREITLPDFEMEQS